MQKGGVKSLLILLQKSIDTDAQRFSALAIANTASARKRYYFFVIYEYF